MPEIPQVSIAPFKTIRGAAHLTTLTPGPGEPYGTNDKGLPAEVSMHPVPLHEAAEAEHTTDAMMTTYVVKAPDGSVLEAYPRLTKGVLAQLVCDFGCSVEHNYVILDVDFKLQPGWTGEDTWNNPKAVAIWDRLSQIKPFYSYATEHGLRLVFRLARPVPAGPGYEALVQRIMDKVALLGILPDPACKDWTRFYRLPRVRKDTGVVTGDAAWFREQGWFEDAPIEPSVAELAPVQLQVLTVRPITSGIPDVGEAMDLAHTHQSQVRDAINDGEVSRIIFEGEQFATEGARHSKLSQLVGLVVRALVPFEWASPELAFGCLAGPALGLGDDEKENFVEKAWGMVCSWWPREKAKFDAPPPLPPKAANDEAPTDNESAFLKNVKEWLPPEAHTDPVEFIRANRLGIMVDQIAARCHVLRQDGFYCDEPCLPERLPLRVRELGMTWLVPIEEDVVTKKGHKTVPIKVPIIIADSGRTFSRVRFSLRHDGSFVELKPDQAVFNIVPFKLRSDLVPEYNPTVEEWLRLMVREQDYDLFIRALCCMIAIDHGPTAAVMLTGPRSVGKKMIATALAECFTNGILVPGDVLTARFNDPLLRGPIIWCDEGVSNGVVDFADSFRRIVTGGTMSVEPKNRSRIDVVGVHRVFFTANNTRMLHQLIGTKARSRHDIEALNERIIHFDALEDGNGNAPAAEFLAKRGGLDFTRGWIRGDDDSPSGFVLARHLLWHYHNTLVWKDGHPVRLGQRLLIEGRAISHPDNALRLLGSDTGGMPLVATTIDQLLNVQSPQPKARVQDGLIYTTHSAISQALKTSAIGMAEVREAIIALCDHRKDTRVDGRQGSWLVFDPKTVLECVRQYALPSKLLLELAGEGDPMPLIPNSLPERL